MGSRYIGLAAALALAGGALAWLPAREARSTTEACTTVMGSELCTWVVMERGRAVELGATVPMALIAGVPLDAEMVWPPVQLAAIALPAEARSALGIDHLGLNWEAHGHPPAAFLTKHFDLHFYNIPPERVRAIDCTDESKPSKLPAGYALPDVEIPGMGVLVGLCVPSMGMHAMPVEETTQTGPFDASMIIGYYGGEPVFFEPMISRDLLLGRSAFALRLPEIDGLPEGVRYPKELQAEYVAARSEYRMVFSGFTAG